MNARIAPLVGLALAGCGPGGGEPGTCAPEPAELGRACLADGECGDWLHCDSGACALPPANRGWGGQRLAIETAAGAVVIEVEVARSDIARQRGLAFRPCILDGWGLLLEFPSPGEHLITMDSMRFPLDLAMIGADGVVQTVHRDAQVGSKVLFGSPGSVSAVLETPAGSLAAEAGDRVRGETDPEQL